MYYLLLKMPSVNNIPHSESQHFSLFSFSFFFFLGGGGGPSRGMAEKTRQTKIIQIKPAGHNICAIMYAFQVTSVLSILIFQV